MIKEFEEYSKSETDADDATYQEIQRRGKKEEIKEYQKLFKEEEDRF